MNVDPSAWLLRLYHAGVAAASPGNCLSPNWPTNVKGKTGVIACGKAAVQMATLAVDHYGRDIEGIVIYPENATLPDDLPESLRWYGASHPIPSDQSVEGAKAALDFASSLAENDLLLVLLSGGGSSLMCLPATGISLAEKQDLGRQLLASGATISEINCIRQHLSRIKGGRLANACRAPVVTLAISDIPGDDPAMISSGPTCESYTTLEQAREIVERYGINPSAAITEKLNEPGSANPSFDKNLRREIKIVASGNTALNKAAALCEKQGIEPIVLGDRLEGEARSLGRQHAALAIERLEKGQTCCVLSGGETTVTIKSKSGKGGRNTEYALALALGLEGRQGVWALAADTDGIDGFGGHAGAVISPSTLSRARKLGLDPQADQDKNDSAGFFERAGGLLIEGPTGTNVNDFRAILIRP